MLHTDVFSIAVVGPTAGGKTALSIALAKRLSGEIISADSMQIYKEFKLGTAKPSETERAEIPHHLIDIKSLSEPYSAADFARDALQAAREIEKRAHLPILCGGTGLYLKALMTGQHEDTPDIQDSRFRLACLAAAETEEGREALWQQLCAVDPLSGEKIHKNNLRRVIRALELYHKTGIPKSEWDKRATDKSEDITVIPFLLDYRDRLLLYRRIDARVDSMVAKGLIEEAEILYQNRLLSPDTTAGQAIGYKEFIPYFTGMLTKDAAVSALKQATRRYAKRQLTWFRNQEGFHTLYADREDGSLKTADALSDEVIAILEKTPRLL